MGPPVRSARPLAPLLLEPNRFPRFYRGGTRIDQLRGGTALGATAPEDWIASVTPTLDDPGVGPTRLPTGELLRAAIEADPCAYLGPQHAARHGSDPALLVKLLDAAERLPVHCHPGRAFASERLGEAHGKTEAWIIVEADPGATVHLGLREAVDRETLVDWLATQDSEAMLDALHTISVAPGDAILVPAGTLHAIGAGILLVELQEPSDQSLVLEWAPYGVDSGSEHLRLGWDSALDVVDRQAADPAALVRRAGGRPETGQAERLLPTDADPYFRADRIRPGGRAVALEPAFAVLVVLAGRGTLEPAAGEAIELTRGDTCLVPFAAGPSTLSGSGLDVIRCRPPATDAPDGAW